MRPVGPVGPAALVGSIGPLNSISSIGRTISAGLLVPLSSVSYTLIGVARIAEILLPDNKGEINMATQKERGFLRSAAAQHAAVSRGKRK
jgi:hypothetical protein